MINKNLFKKSLTFTIVVLLFGTGFFPIISGDSEFKVNDLTTEESFLDAQYIYNITKALSDIIFEYNESAGELAKGRFFGTKGEHKAAKILFDNMTKLGLFTKMEQIHNIEGPLRPKLSKLTHKIEILDYGLKINNETIVDFHIVPSKNGPRCDPGNLDYNFSYTGLKVYEKPEFLLPWKIKHLLSEKEDFVFIEQSTSFNPHLMPPLKKILSKFIDPMRKPMMFGYKLLKRGPDQERLYRFSPNCKGIINYDYHINTYNQGGVESSIPIIYINGTIGKKILNDLEHASVDFYLNQRYNDSVISYNVIGQLNGTDPTKTVIVDCLYDSWWTQGTADSAIGMAMVLGIAKYFRDHKITPKYNIKFIGFCGEEIGLRGAQYYEATHSKEDILYVVDLNQICFWQDGPRLTLNVICNKLSFMRELWRVVEKTDYKEITKDTADIKLLWMPTGAPSDDQVFVKRPRCKTVCFLKDTGWLLHHRDGLNHQEGDVMKYFDWDDVNATGQIILNITKFLTVNDP